MWFSLWRQKSDILSVHGPPIPLSTYSRFSGSIGVTRGHGGPSKGDAWTVKMGNKCQKLTSRSFFYLIWLYGGELFGRKLWIVKMLKVYTKLLRPEREQKKTVRMIVGHVPVVGRFPARWIIDDSWLKCKDVIG